MANDRQQRAARAEQMRKEREKANRRQRNVITIAIVVVVAVLVGLAGFAIKGISDDNTASGKFVAPKNITGDFGIVFDAEAAGGKVPADGAKPVTVELYEDFLCPGCGALEASSGQFLTDQVKAGAIEIEYRPYAFLLEQSSNEYSQRAWNSAACVVDKGGPKAFKAYHDLLFANQPQEGGAGPEDSDLVAFAKTAGVTGIDACVKKEKFTPWIEAAREQGTKDGVNGTPAVRIAGKDISGAGNTIPTTADLQKAITAAAKG